MSDRDILEQAAKAVGLKHDGYTNDFFDPECSLSTGLKYGACPQWIWNPLENNDDAFRLLVDMGMWIDVNDQKNQTSAGDCHGEWRIIKHDGNKQSATRLAIVMTAIDIWNYVGKDEK